ncbi:helix-turn-helix transcriptional regulator [Neorhizobium sp. T786]|uniref:transcriptional regulator VisN n=1 Tax=Pseudorhizobium xiangyangii TaxID=2883104 RepID=UPI001CFF9799|nr:helix-turn-helix transcriptional regulator [Neorhizobium xiangyangii]MCB5202633.1 helix-turn-helix transcriptional regulator [Neorhizobium xiangyangii]
MKAALDSSQVDGEVSRAAVSREQLVRKLALAASAHNIPAALHLLATYADASRFLMARCDLIQEQGLDFIVSSDWPFDLVRHMETELAASYARSNELEKCLSLLMPTFSVLPDNVLVPEGISRQYCSLSLSIGRTRYSLQLLFREGTILSQERLREVGLLAGYAASFKDSTEPKLERDFELTDRELECLFWIAEGKTSDEIATILGISRNTINNYITSVMRKTGTKTRSEAIAYAVRNNLV